MTEFASQSVKDQVNGELAQLEYPPEYFDAQVQFAQKWSELTGDNFSEVILGKTAVGRRMFMHHPTEAALLEPVWVSEIDDLNGADHVEVTNHLYGQYANNPENIYLASREPESAFGYEFKPTMNTVKIHFTNPKRGSSPLSDENMPSRQQEFHELLERVRVEHPEAAMLMSASWLRSTRHYRSLSPPDIAEQVDLTSPNMTLTGNSVWGQFVNSNGEVNSRVYAQFLNGLGGVQSLGELVQQFPYKTLMAHDPIQKYYDFYGLQ